MALRKASIGCAHHRQAAKENLVGWCRRNVPSYESHHQHAPINGGGTQRGVEHVAATGTEHGHGDRSPIGQRHVGFVVPTFAKERQLRPGGHAPFELGLSGEGTDLRDLMPLTAEEVAERQRDAQHDLAATQKAAAILRRGGANAYDKALRTLMPDSREWWQEYVEDEDEEHPATAEGLADFIRDHLEPICVRVEKEARHHEAIKAQALGEGLQVHRLEKLTRYETHLDRKFERTLGMLLKLKELRGGR